MVIEGTVSRRDNTLNVMAERAWPLSLPFDDRRRQDLAVAAAERLRATLGTTGSLSVKFRMRRDDATRALRQRLPTLHSHHSG